LTEATTGKYTIGFGAAIAANTAVQLVLTVNINDDDVSAVTGPVGLSTGALNPLDCNPVFTVLGYGGLIRTTGLTATLTQNGAANNAGGGSSLYDLELSGFIATNPSLSANFELVVVIENGFELTDVCTSVHYGPAVETLYATPSTAVTSALNTAKTTLTYTYTEGLTPTTDFKIINTITVKNPAVTTANGSIKVYIKDADSAYTPYRAELSATAVLSATVTAPTA